MNKELENSLDEAWEEYKQALIHLKAAISSLTEGREALLQSFQNLVDNPHFVKP